jgi:hypothetical protein
LDSVPFNPNNINLYGTKMLDKLFTSEDMAEGTIDPKIGKKPPLSPNRVNKIKGNVLILLNI